MSPRSGRAGNTFKERFRWTTDLRALRKAVGNSGIERKSGGVRDVGQGKAAEGLGLEGTAERGREWSSPGHLSIKDLLGDAEVVGVFLGFLDGTGEEAILERD